MSTNKISKSKVKKKEVEEVFRPIHYLGSKLRILDFIENTIDTIDPNRGRVCDLFSGSGSVSFKLSKTRPVTSVDIQEYSKTICFSLLNPINIDQYFIDSFIQKCSESPHTKKLTNTVSSLISYEEECIVNALNQTDTDKLCEILENGSLVSFEINKKSIAKTELSKLIKKTLIDLDKKNILNYKSLAVRYFGGVYFSYKQAVEIDALLEEIENSPKEFRNMLLASLLSTASECVNTVGKQFAQPIRPRKSNGEPKPSLGKVVNKDRSMNIFTIFIKWLNRYNKISNNGFENKILKMDFNDALDKLTNDISVVYADPPYTREHYSRFYHVLETLALRDTPQISTMVLSGERILSRGLYREKRHQSPFCIRSSAPSAFESLFSKVSAIGAKLVLSYSPYDETKGSHPRVITMTQLIELANKYYSNVEVLSPGTFTHSKLTNSAKHLEASVFAEVLIVCS